MNSLYRLAPFALAVMACALAADAPRIQVHGHRGARARRPENTLPAFQYAIEQGVDALEMDMAVTRDNVIVISHDPVLRPPVCSGPREHSVIHTLTLAEVNTGGQVHSMPALFKISALRLRLLLESGPVNDLNVSILDLNKTLCAKAGEIP